MDDNKVGVAATGMLVAAMRAEESRQENRLFTDPYAERLAGDKGRGLLAEAEKATGNASGQIIVRTRFWDEALLRVNAAGASKMVILAAGMDARAYRLPWQANTTVYEIDQAEVMGLKNDIMADVQPQCHRVTVGVDLAHDWPRMLESEGFDSAAKTVWLVEGLLQYLDASAVDVLFSRIDEMSAAGSVLMYEVVGKKLLEAPFLKPTLDFMEMLNAPWIFGTDEPADLVERRGWTATVTDIAEAGNAWHRWDHPAVPLDVPGVPRGYFIEATKR
jgi:methyltransferase (TIGR00027 family)